MGLRPATVLLLFLDARKPQVPFLKHIQTVPSGCIGRIKADKLVSAV